MYRDIRAYINAILIKPDIATPTCPKLFLTTVDALTSFLYNINISKETTAKKYENIPVIIRKIEEKIKLGPAANIGIARQPDPIAHPEIMNTLPIKFLLSIQFPKLKRKNVFSAHAVV